MSVMVTLKLNMRRISSVFSIMFLRRISIDALFRLFKQGTSCARTRKNQPALSSGHRTCHEIGPPGNPTPENRGT